VRFRLALLSTRSVNLASRVLRRGQGTVAGGRAGLRMDPRLLERLSAGRSVALVSGTNGKTTTTRLLAVAWGADGDGVVSNETGSNMPPGHVAALVADRSSTRAVLEVDEIYLPRVLSATSASVVLLLNLSRDQLDRSNEVRMIANRWRAALAAAPHTQVVANADDPLVVWGAGAASHVHWVSVGLRWQLDAGGCPSCSGRIIFDEASWSCEDACGLIRPTPEATLVIDGVGAHVDWSDGGSTAFTLQLPGRFNLANAVLAAVAAGTQGVDRELALAAMAAVPTVAGRFSSRLFGEQSARLMLAKNPAGWSELLDLVVHEQCGVVVSINARTADGADPSWLWDVPFEQLAGRRVVATGDRCRDLSVRLHYAGVEHSMEMDPVAAIAAASQNGAVVDVIGNYTAFNELLRQGSPIEGNAA
jgi:UDP-N-acetylmuramyl tripeptide synthase